MPTTVSQYVIKGRMEETDCDHCGCPLYNMDTAYYLKEDDGHSYCSKSCASRRNDVVMRVEPSNCPDQASYCLLCGNTFATNKAWRDHSEACLDRAEEE